MLAGIVTAMVLLSVQPLWADEERGCAKEHGGGYGGPGYGMMGHHGGTGHYLRHLLMHQKEIGLSEEQVTKLKAIQLDLDRTRIRTEAEVQVAERELEALVHDEKSDLAAIEAKLKQSEGLEVGLRLAAIKTKREAMALLTPEQREKEKAEHEKMMKMMGERRMGERGGMGPGMMPGGPGSPPKAGPKKDAEKKEPKH
jgi:Spy/CpxP family protein refolding chaperone